MLDEPIDEGDVTGLLLSRVAGGKIQEDRSNWDALGMLQQLGVVPPME
jgi:hypothetical protein